MGDIWIKCGWYLNGIWIISGWYVGDIWIICGWYLDNMWVISGWYVDDIWMISGWNVDDMWMISGWYLDDMWVIILHRLMKSNFNRIRFRNVGTFLLWSSILERIKKVQKRWKIFRNLEKYSKIESSFGSC